MTTRKRTVVPYVDEESGTHNEGDVGISTDSACDERTGVNVPLVYQLSCQGHRWVATSGRDNR